MPARIDVELDGFLVDYAGDPEGELPLPNPERWHLLQLLLPHYDVTVVTWREPGLVLAWMEDHGLSGFLGEPGFSVTNRRRPGTGVGYLAACPVDQLDLRTMVDKLQGS